MSYMKRHLEDRIDEIANKYGLSWDYVYDLAVYLCFDLDELEEKLSLQKRLGLI